MTLSQAGAWVGFYIDDEATISALGEGKNIFQVACKDGIFILRFPENQEQLDVLRKEASIQRAVRDRVDVLFPDTQVFESDGVIPSFAIHRKIPGNPLTDECLEGMSASERIRLVQDMADLFHELHSIPLETACRWLSFDLTCGYDRQELAKRFGKPLWFDSSMVLKLRDRLDEQLSSREREIFEETAARFQKIQVAQEYMVFGHGDLHGYNMAVLDGAQGCRLNGVFDLGCSGILDIHEDFFRISLVSEGLLDEILVTYQGLTRARIRLDRQRIGLYYRAFLFYLMGEQQGEGLAQLKRMLAKHLNYYPSYPQV